MNLLAGVGDSSPESEPTREGVGSMANKPNLSLDLDSAIRHLQLLAGEPDPVVAWQVFDDQKTRPSLARGEQAPISTGQSA